MNSQLMFDSKDRGVLEYADILIIFKQFWIYGEQMSWRLLEGFNFHATVDLKTVLRFKNITHVQWCNQASRKSDDVASLSNI